MSSSSLSSDYDARFGGIQRLYGSRAQQRLREARVCVVGIGGVGSWVVEALARTGLGALTLVDLDEVCISNVNRQLPALTSEIGQPKVQVMARRISEINPSCLVDVREDFFTQATAADLLNTAYDCVVDAIDSVSHKCLLLARCRDLSLPVLTVGGAGGRRNPAAIQVADLAFTSHDRLLQKVRKTLRTEHHFPSNPGTPFGIPCVYSAEPPAEPADLPGACLSTPAASGGRRSCDRSYGAATFVTGAFGFVAAAEVVNLLVATPPKSAS